VNLSIDESINEIDHGNPSQRKNQLESKEQQRNSDLPTNEVLITDTTQTDDATNSAAGTVTDTTKQSVSVLPDENL